MAVLTFSLAACSGGGGDAADDGGGNPPPPSTDVDLTAQERAALVAALLDLETKASDAGQAQQARVARGAGYTTVADVDNWMVNVRTQGAAARTPVWTGCSDTAAGGICYVNLADDKTVSLTFE
jgi:hypothetical protein